MRYLTIGVVLLAMGAITSGWAETPQYKPVPVQLFTTRHGLGNVLAKLEAGEEVRIAYFGGSITAANGWRPKTLQWFRERWPKAKVVEINAAIGGTGSDLGVYRFGQDVLSKNPDLVFVEFSVNDGGASPENIWRGMEGCIRQAWKQNPYIDFCYVYTFRGGYENDLKQGLYPRAAGADEMLAEYYGIPSVNVALPIVQMEQAGKLIYVPQKDAEGKPLPPPEGVMLFSNDNVHPLDAAHGVYAQTIADAVLQMAAASKAGPHELKAPFIADNWERARIVALQPSMLTPGWRLLDPKQGLAATFLRFMPQLWEATQPGERIHFKFRGTAVRLYDLLGPDGGQALITLDGKTRGPVPRFDSYCTYHRIACLSIADNLPDEVHEVTVEISPDQPDRRIVTDKEKDKPGFDPKKYDGTAMRVSGIMLQGDLVE